MTAAQMGYIKKWAWKWANRTESDPDQMFQDFMQEALLAEFLKKDPIDAVRFAWRRWCFGVVHHRRIAFEKPVFIDIDKFANFLVR